ncbi:MAG TPA: DUF1877 family protein [Actinokineospora sp.]|jgi:hypothetical protein|nr:DUF1877 family protein [Actinokineospora sp.]
MAVTQQIARLPAELLAECRLSVEVLDRLCSFKAAGVDHLDLDWAPRDLRRVCDLARTDGRLRDAVRDAMAGDAEVNPEYAEYGDIAEHPVTELTPARVAEIAGCLRELDVETIFAVLPADAELAKAALGPNPLDFDNHPTDYLAPHLTALRDFYEQAAQRGQATIMWWD